MLRDQVRALGGELLVGDGHGDGWRPELDPDVVWLCHPGEDRLQLHARALARARGEVVGITEDHVRPADDWCAAVLRAHADRPETDAIIGAVRNGSRSHAFERASFLLTSAPYMPPLRQLPPYRSPPFNNFSLKRRAVPDNLAPGDLELVIIPELYKSNAMAADDRIVIEHVQDVTAIEALKMHFHNGRTHGGTFVDYPDPSRKFLTRHAFGLPVKLAHDTQRAIRERPGSGYDWIDVAAVGVIGCAHLLGFLVGINRGRGDSPRKIT